MPLVSGDSKTAISANIKKEMPALRKKFPDKSDKEIQKQAVAIALRKSREFDDASEDEVMSAAERWIEDEEEREGEDIDDDDEAEEMTGRRKVARLMFRVESAGRLVRNGYAIYPNSILFRAGKFPERGFEITQHDITRMVATFDPDFVNRETNLMHSDVLKLGTACKLFRVWQDASDPTILRGEVGVPVELDKLLNTKSLSIELHPRSLNTIVGLAIDPNPRVKEAVLMAKPPKPERTIHGQDRLQNVHDIVHEYVTDPATNTGYQGYEEAGRFLSRGTKFTSPKEFGHLQAIHEVCVSGGAACPNPSAPNQVVMSGSSNKKGGLMARFREALFGLRTKADDSEKEVIDQIVEEIAARESDATRREAVTTLKAESVDFSANPTVQALQEELSALKGQLETVQDDNRERRADERARRAQEIEREAVAFADHYTSKDVAKATPAERDIMISLFKAAAANDDRTGNRKITFSVKAGETKQGTNVEALRAAYDIKPSLSRLFRETVADPTIHTMLTNGAEPKTDDEKARKARRDASLMRTPEGRRALELERAGTLFTGTNGHGNNGRTQ